MLSHEQVHLTKSVMYPIVPTQLVSYTTNRSQLLITTHDRREEKLRAYLTQIEFLEMRKRYPKAHS